MKKKKLIMKKCNLQKQWARLSMKWILTKYAREGNLPACKRFLETFEGSEWSNGFLKETLKETLGNMARSACRFKVKRSVGASHYTTLLGNLI
jgi:hypothetical protein